MTKPQTHNPTNPVNCNFCGAVIVFANCDKLVFKAGDFHAEIEFKRASYIEVRCGKCRETTIIRNPKKWKGKN